MCGINGFNFNDEPLIKRMNAAIKHRGPDDEGVFVDESTSLGHVRLSILDLSSAGHQPMKSDSGHYVIVYNGEIYNFKEIRADLEREGFSFATGTDTEVILTAFEAEGINCFKKFNGIVVRFFHFLHGKTAL